MRYYFYIGSGIFAALIGWIASQMLLIGAGERFENAPLDASLDRLIYVFYVVKDKEAKEEAKTLIIKDIDIILTRIDGANTPDMQKKVRKEKSYEFISSEYTDRVLYKKNPGWENQMKKSGENNESSDVKKVQKMLKLLLPSYDHGEVDGIYGNTTEKAVKEFQKLQTLKPTGNVNLTTWHAMTQRFTDKQVAVAAQFLLKSFETYDGSKPEEINSDIKNLKKCKSPAIDYIDCVKKLINNQASAK